MSLDQVAIITLLILLNGLFVAAEFAIVGAPRATIERLARQGHRRARLVRRIIGNVREQDRAIATAQLGITLASLGLGMYGEHLLADWIAGYLEALGGARWATAHAIASVIAVTVLTYFHIVLGEMVPKSLALQQPQRTALTIAPVLRLVQLAMYPVVLILNGLGNGVLRLVGVVRRAGGEQYRTLEELAIMVRESAGGGLIRPENAQVVTELFEFSGLVAAQVMVPRVRVVGLPLGAAASDICAVLSRSPHTRYPVYEDSLDHIVGVVHVKDLLRCLPDCSPLSRSDLHPLPFLPETAHLDEVLAATRQQGGEMAVIMDEHGGTAGILTVEDLFEEVVGEFGEDRGGSAELYRDPEGRLHVPGTMRLWDVGQELGVVLEHEEVDSTSGLILALLGRPPRVGDAVEYDEVRFEVSQVEGHGIRQAIASALRQAQPSGSGRQSLTTPRTKERSPPS
ncbi:MAG: hemolysin family protein [Gemmatimonadales bacterium]